MNKKSVRDIDVAGKRVLVRVDFNVPLDAERHITDDTRIRASLPTIQYLLDNGAAVILMSHLGRPKGEVNKKYSLAPAAQRLSELLGRPVQMAPDCIGPEVEAQAKALQPGQVLLLENLRFHKAEGYEIGDSLFEEGNVETARDLMTKARQHELELLLPIDVVVADRFEAGANTRVVDSSQVEPGWRIMDIGPKTIDAFQRALADAQTIIFNGTLGVAEWPAFAKGTSAIIEALAERTKAGATTIIGGGDFAAAVEQADAGDKMSPVSTGGGAPLEFLEGGVLPGGAAFQEKG